LLALSSPEEREHIESEFFEDEDAFQAMLAAEDDLIDAYARGELAGEERRRFEKNFVSSFAGRDRVQFARAFASVVSDTEPVTLLNPLKTFQSPRLFQTATITTITILVVAFAWLVIDRRRTINELRDLRAESAEVSKRTEALQRSSDGERTRTAEIPPQRTHLSPEPEKPRHRERATTASQRTTLDGVSVEPVNTYLLPRNVSGRGDSTVRGTAQDLNGNVLSGAIVTLIDSARNFIRTQSTNKDGTYVFNAIPPGTYSIRVQASGFKTASILGLVARVDAPTILDVQLELGAVSDTIDITAAAEATLNTSDATLGNSFETKRITELPLNANNVVGLLSLQPGVSRTGFVNGERTDQSNVTLDGVDVNSRISGSLGWIRFQLTLETPAIHDHYRVIIKTADDRLVTSIEWTEPRMPNQTIIYTPALPTLDLSFGQYVLLLMGKESNSSFVKVAEYSFSVIRY